MSTSAKFHACITKCTILLKILVYLLGYIAVTHWEHLNVLNGYKCMDNIYMGQLSGVIIRLADKPICTYS